jgi:hypothetical protein
MQTNCSRQFVLDAHGQGRLTAAKSSSQSRSGRMVRGELFKMSGLEPVQPTVPGVQYHGPICISGIENQCDQRCSRLANEDFLRSKFSDPLAGLIDRRSD